LRQILSIFKTCFISVNYAAGRTGSITVLKKLDSLVFDDYNTQL